MITVQKQPLTTTVNHLQLLPTTATCHKCDNTSKCYYRLPPATRMCIATYYYLLVVNDKDYKDCSSAHRCMCFFGTSGTSGLVRQCCARA